MDSGNKNLHILLINNYLFRGMLYITFASALTLELLNLDAMDLFNKLLVQSYRINGIYWLKEVT